jgi:hypothetical protein
MRKETATITRTGVFRLLLVVAGLIGICGPVRADLFIGAGEDILRFDESTGAPLGTFASIPGGFVTDLIFGPSGDLFVFDRHESRIWRFDGVTGASLGGYGFPMTPGYLLNNWLAFGPDGHLYVTDSAFSVQRLSGPTGTDIDPGFGTSGRIIFEDSPTALAFGPDGNLYVGTAANLILRFDGETGAPLGTFRDPVSAPLDMSFGPGDDLYLMSFFGSSIQRFDGMTAMIEPGFGAFTPESLAFREDGTLFVADEFLGIVRSDPTFTSLQPFIPKSALPFLPGPHRLHLAFSPSAAAPVPEPGTLTLTLVGLVALLGCARRYGVLDNMPVVRRTDSLRIHARA